MASVNAVTYFVIGFVVIHVSLLLWVKVVLPKTVDRTRRYLESSPFGSLFWGLAALVVAAGFACILLWFRMWCVKYAADLLAMLSTSLNVNRVPNDAYMIAQVIVWMLLGPVMAAWILGGAAFAEVFAARFQRQYASEARIRSFLIGAFCVSAGAFLPFVGWFVFLPIVGVMSIGAGARSLVPIGLSAEAFEKAATVHNRPHREVQESTVHLQAGVSR